ncbi:unnamed protein product [Caenorhabditis sp. 36 PRJEB53466]|nr:unnamed protein product [Caenorhabditis sp. 36 PRJEB53466]
MADQPHRFFQPDEMEIEPEDDGVHGIPPPHERPEQDNLYLDEQLYELDDPQAEAHPDVNIFDQLLQVYNQQGLHGILNNVELGAEVFGPAFADIAPFLAAEMMEMGEVYAAERNVNQ